VAPRPDVARVLILERDVEGSWCKQQYFPSTLFLSRADNMAANYALAVADAIRRVPDGEVLVDATLTTVVEDFLFRVEKCAIVRGDVGRIE